MTDLRNEEYRLEQFRLLEKEARDPLAARLVHEIVCELEARLEAKKRRRGKAGHEPPEQRG